MRIRSVDVMRVAIPFRLTFRHARASRDRSESMLVRVRDAEGHSGYGECAPREYVTGETPASTRAALEQRLAAPWVGSEFAAFGDVVGALTECQDGLRRDEHAAFCALELALLDLAGRVFRRGAGDALGPRIRAYVYYSGVIPAGEFERAMEFCTACKRMGLPSVKLKVGASREDDRAVIEGARRILGPECSIRVDANGAWSADEALERVADYHHQGIEAVEQPVPADDLEGLMRVTAASPIPVVVDESLVSWHDGVRLIEARAAHVFNIRISKNGGLLAAGRLRRLAVSRGLPWMLGAQVGETAILSAAGRQLATRAEAPQWCEGSFGSLLLSEDIGVEDLTFGPGGRAPALDGDGLGITIRDDLPGDWEAVPVLAGTGVRNGGTP